MAAHRHREGSKPQLQELPHSAARAPIWYEFENDIQLNRGVGIIHREDYNQKQKRPVAQRGRPFTKRKSLPAKKSFPAMTTKTMASSRLIEEPVDRKKDSDIIADEEGDVDDNMSLISMTNLIADDVCQLQNCRFENIGPDIQQRDVKKEYKTLKPRDSRNGNFGNENTTKRTTSNTTRRDRNSELPNPKKTHAAYTVWDNHPPLDTTEYGTPDTGSLTSGQSRSSGEHRASQIEFEVVDESDSISEITPTGCAVIDARNKERHKAKQKNARKRTSNQGYSDKNRKELSPEENLHELLVSMAACLPYLGDSKDIRRSVSDAQTKFDSIDTKAFLQRTGITNQCCEPNQTSNLSYTRGTEINGSSIPYRNFDFASGSIASAPATPLFKNNLDRYNKLVIGLMESDDELSTMVDERQIRKFSPSWFKTKREINKRRNNTQIIQPPATDHKKSKVPGNMVPGGANVEVVWKQSRSFKEHKKILTKTGSVEAVPTPSTKFPTRTPILKKLLKRGKSKDPIRPDAEAPLVESVSITAKDPTKWQPENAHPPDNSVNNQRIEGVTSCVSSTVKTTGDLSIDLCNSDITMDLVPMAIVGAPPVAVAKSFADPSRSDSRAAVPRGDFKTQSKNKTASIDPAVTRNVVTPSRNSCGPVWRGDRDPNFHPRWPKADATTQQVPREREDFPRKNRLRCYHRNSQHIDLGDNDSGPTMEWTQSRSYEEDDCGQEDIKVVSIIGHHVSSSELEQYASGSATEKGIFTNSLPSDRDCKRRIEAEPRHSRGVKKSSRGSPSSSSASSSESSSYSSLSSSSLQRQSRGTRTSRHLPPRQSDKDRRPSRNEIATPKAEDAFGGSAAIGSPWPEDYRTHVSSKTASANKIHRIPMTPPKIHRSTNPHDVFGSNARNISPLDQIKVPVQRRNVERQNVAL